MFWYFHEYEAANRDSIKVRKPTEGAQWEQDAKDVVKVDATPSEGHGVLQRERPGRTSARDAADRPARPKVDKKATDILIQMPNGLVISGEHARRSHVPEAFFPRDELMLA
ncbi:hypothetical protein H0G86_000363 [Trichoderma simmonsii]|uniref:Uncharacterized protein n=1 Tax=Trichoderma simmonsii TaxID=1491479 RepID=A0A8G0P9E4_9HYPO|nr:hypothetical protein H0G86_000363 [Trichoderma simmonsii]